MSEDRDGSVGGENGSDGGKDGSVAGGDVLNGGGDGSAGGSSTVAVSSLFLANRFAPGSYASV